MSFTKESLKYDEMARNLCKPLGCRVARCMRAPQSTGCGQEMAALTSCIRQKREEIAVVVREKRSLSTIEPVR
jgi:hypothetical protein